MNLLTQYVCNFLRYKLFTITADTKYYSLFNKNYSFRKVSLKNKLLAYELELACQKNNGFLTYAEFLAIDQFGKNGYHTNHSFHGMTDAARTWKAALPRFCQENDIHTIIEFGPGDGTLSINTIKELKKANHKMMWHGIEINETLQKQILMQFKKENLLQNLGSVTSSFKTMRVPKKTLFLFSYSLDSLPPEIFIQTEKNRSFPSSILGITVKNGVLTEMPLSKNQLSIKKRFLSKGVYRNNANFGFDISSWNLFPGERAYIPIDSLTLLMACVKKAQKDSIFLIIDEFHAPPMPWETGHLLLPRDLYSQTRVVNNIEKAYKNSGEYLFYFSLYFNTFLTFSHALGFNKIYHDIEQKFACEIEQKQWIPKKIYYTTYVFMLSSKTRPIPRILPIQFPKVTLI